MTNKSGHAPRKWKVDKNERVGGWAILDGDTNPKSIGYVEGKANAQLIAAAPELLEACQMVVKSKRGVHLSAETVACLMEAINKAEGK